MDSAVNCRKKRIKFRISIKKRGISWAAELLSASQGRLRSMELLYLQIHIIVCMLFIDGFSITSYGRMTDEWIWKDLEGSGQNRIRCHLGICLEGLRKNEKIPSKKSQCPGFYSKHLQHTSVPLEKSVSSHLSYAAHMFAANSVGSESNQYPSWHTLNMHLF
jgi:hypothetical protein